MSEMQSVARSLFDLPVEIKQQHGDAVAGGKGYSPVQEANPLIEGLDVYDMDSPGAVHAFCSHLQASPNQRETILRYTEAIHELTMTIGSKLAKSMGMDSNLFKDWLCRFRLNKYHFTPHTIGSTGARMHTDASLLTVLNDDEMVKGLEIVDNKSGAVIPIDPMPASLLVFVGDIGKVWSNGRFCNLKHRVQCVEGRVRVSIVLFLLEPKEAKVEASPELVDSDHPRLFVPFTFEEYYMRRSSTSSASGEALEFFRTPLEINEERV
ncbi:2-oxoglutarate-dependent dioxygenase DAO-like [Cornus florida]|uniref:2-oxoglutarate-dependent dioxygenase DAO-like n=1 Tax=Cornus florida TaxID=4283 RepID=UPI0028A0CA02|nr:2-oxoglutarate-dependent dioxygenase DAO-like [Cornus florida]